MPIGFTPAEALAAAALVPMCLVGPALVEGDHVRKSGILFSRLGPGEFELQITFKRFNPNPFTIAMTLDGRTLCYGGLGPPIGDRLDTFGLYSLSLTAIQKYVF